MLALGPDPARAQALIILPALTIACPDHGPMSWRAMAWRCGECPAQVTEADMARLARWLGGERPVSRALARRPDRP